MRSAGNVWLKLADYGISQVSTGSVMRVRNQPVGTPGYMAPELFEQAGQQVSSVKVSASVQLHGNDGSVGWCCMYCVWPVCV